ADPLRERAAKRGKGRRHQPLQHLGHARPGVAEQEAGRRPVAGRMVGHGREHRRADRVDEVHAVQVADDPVGPLGQVLQQHPLDLGCREQVDLTVEGDHDAPVADGMVKLHSGLPALPFAAAWTLTVLLPAARFPRSGDPTRSGCTPGWRAVGCARIVGVDGRSAMEAVRGPLGAAGRVALAAMFITGGADALFDPGPRAPKAAEIGVPLDPEVAVRANGAAMLAAGVALALGLWPRPAAAVLAGSLVPTTLAGHPYWRVEDPAMRRQQRVHFFKNVGLFGGGPLVLKQGRGRRP